MAETFSPHLEAGRLDCWLPQHRRPDHLYTIELAFPRTYPGAPQQLALTLLAGDSGSDGVGVLS